MKLAKQDKRAETGAMQFGDDWQGFFFRGDDCMQQSSMLRYLRKIYKIELEGLDSLIDSFDSAHESLEE